MIFILLRSLKPPGEEEGSEARWGGDGETTSPPFTPLLLFSAVQWKADLRRAVAAGPVVAVPGEFWPPAFQRYWLLSVELVALFTLAEGVDGDLSLLVASPPKALWGRVRTFGDRGFRDVLVWAPAEEETHLYLEVLWAMVTGLSFRGIFLTGVLLLDGGELPLEALEAEAWETDTTFPWDEETELACLDSSPAAIWLFTHVNLDFFWKDLLTWAWLVWEERWVEGCFTNSDTAGGSNGTSPVVGTTGVGLLLGLLIREGLICTWVLIFTEAGASEETPAISSGTACLVSVFCWNPWVCLCWVSCCKLVPVELLRRSSVAGFLDASSLIPVVLLTFASFFCWAIAAIKGAVLVPSPSSPLLWLGSRMLRVSGWKPDWCPVEEEVEAPWCPREVSGFLFLSECVFLQLPRVWGAKILPLEL